MRVLSSLGLLFTAIVLNLSAAFAEDYPKGKLPDTVTPLGYDLQLTIIPENDTFSGITGIDITLNKDVDFIYIHGRDLTVTSAELIQNNKAVAVKYEQLDPLGVSKLTFPKVFKKGQYRLRLTYSAPYTNTPAGLYHLKIGEDWYVWSQLQSIDGRAVFPSFDEPGFKVPFKVSITTKNGLLAVSNAPEVGSRTQKDMTTHTFRETLPLPTYLMAFVVGPFVTETAIAPPNSIREHPLPIRIVATKNHAERLHFAAVESVRIVELLEQYFNQPFPYPKLDQIASPIMPGAMENAGADIYGDNILMLDEGASVGQKQTFGMVVSHELGHQWFGDLVTPAWWDDIWLNESFANWMGYMIGDRWKPELNIGVGGLAEGFTAMQNDSLVVGRPIRSPITDNGDIDQAFDTITYGKGGHVVAMVAGFMGEDLFRDGVRLHMNRYAHKNATTDQFFGSLADAAGDARLLTAMKSFIDQQGVPVIALAQKDGRWVATQSRYKGYGVDAPEQSWIIPVCVRQGDVRSCTLMDQKSQPLKAEGVGMIVPNAGGTGYYRFALSDSDWNALLAQAPSLKSAEGVAVIDSLWAQYAAGEGKAELLITSAKALTANADSNVATESAQKLRQMRTRGFIAPEALPSYQKVMGETYGPLLADLGFNPKAKAYDNEAPDTQSKRQILVNIMAIEARNDATRRALKDAATAYLGGDETALSQTYMGIAFTVYAEDGGLEAVKMLYERANATKNTVLAAALTGAMTQSGNPEAAKWLLDKASDPAMRPTNKLGIVGGLIRNSATRDMAYEWMVAHYDEITKGAGIFAASRISALPSGYCSVEKAAEIDTFMRPKVIAMGRGTLSFDRMIESIATCGKLKAARADDVTNAFVNAAK